MFTKLKAEYKERVVRHWQREMNERLMIINPSNEPTEVLSDDPQEARFLGETAASGPSSDPKSAPSPPNPPGQGEISRYFHFLDPKSLRC